MFNYEKWLSIGHKQIEKTWYFEHFPWKTSVRLLFPCKTSIPLNSYTWKTVTSQYNPVRHCLLWALVVTAFFTISTKEQGLVSMHIYDINLPNSSDEGWKPIMGSLPASTKATPRHVQQLPHNIRIIQFTKINNLRWRWFLNYIEHWQDYAKPSWLCKSVLGKLCNQAPIKI